LKTDTGLSEEPLSQERWAQSADSSRTCRKPGAIDCPVIIEMVFCGSMPDERRYLSRIAQLNPWF